MRFRFSSAIEICFSHNKNLYYVRCLAYWFIKFGYETVLKHDLLQDSNTYTSGAQFSEKSSTSYSFISFENFSLPTFTIPFVVIAPRNKAILNVEQKEWIFVFLLACMFMFCTELNYLFHEFVEIWRRKTSLNQAIVMVKSKIRFPGG